MLGYAYDNYYIFHSSHGTVHFNVPVLFLNIIKFVPNSATNDSMKAVQFEATIPMPSLSTYFASNREPLSCFWTPPRTGCCITLTSNERYGIPNRRSLHYLFKMMSMITATKISQIHIIEFSGGEAAANQCIPSSKEPVILSFHIMMPSWNSFVE